MNYPFTLPTLPYPYDAMEPYIDSETMHYHYDKHLKGYMDKLNNILKQYPYLYDKSLTWLLTNPTLLPNEDKQNILNNAGGIYNHLNYFDNLSNNKNVHKPEGKLKWLIDTQYGSFDHFKEIFSKEAEKVFGSGYLLLTIDYSQQLKIEKVANQDTTLLNGRYPLITLDVWEHAYYLKYKNLRKDYIDAFFNVISFPILK